MLIVIGFSLKRDVSVGAPFHKEPYQSLCDVTEVKPNVQQVFHLLRMDGFVVDSCFWYWAILFTCEYDTEHIDCDEPFERYYVIIYYFHYSLNITDVGT